MRAFPQSAFLEGLLRNGEEAMPLGGIWLELQKLAENWAVTKNWRSDASWGTPYTSPGLVPKHGSGPSRGQRHKLVGLGAFLSLNNIMQLCYYVRLYLPYY